MANPSPRDVLDVIVRNVFGYGRLDAPLWFIKFEEACDDEDDAADRLSALASFDGAQDVFEAHEKMRHPNPVNTSVWREMQVIVRTAGLRDVHVGRRDSDTCLIELLPLPHANKRAWYGKLYGALGYASREKYTDAVLMKRIERIRELVLKNRPKVVLIHHSFVDQSHVKALMGGDPTKKIKIGAKWLYIRCEGEIVWLACANLSGEARWTGQERANLRRAVRTSLARELKPHGAA